MSDRSAATFFSSLFEWLAEDLKKEHVTLNSAKPEGPDWRAARARIDYILTFAGRGWTWTASYDFHPVQMDCNEDLYDLGLAEWREHPDYEDEVQIRFRKTSGEGFESWRE